jgi:hypothetical protein
MTPIKQTKLHDSENSVHGNCMAAALASLLDLSLSDVPAFEEMNDEEWFLAFWHWLNDRGYEMETSNSSDPIEPSETIDGYYIANGPSPRGVYHSVIYKDGGLAHDPHPSNAGLTSVAYCWLIHAKGCP